MKIYRIKTATEIGFIDCTNLKFIRNSDVPFAPLITGILDKTTLSIHPPSIVSLINLGASSMNLSEEDDLELCKT